MTGAMKPAAPLVERFRRDLAALAGEAPGRLGIAVSGGPDSLALLLLADAAFAGQVEAATVDHGLRAGSAAEAGFVARLCAERGIPHRILTVAVSRGGGGLQAEARAARYAALAGWMAERGLGVLLTAHHADDQAETLLMRLNRGSGVAGLAGVRARLPTAAGGLVCRPLLGWRRQELAALAAAAALEPVDDPSNRDEAYDRARLRARMAGADWLDVPALAGSAALLAEAEEALAATARQLAIERIETGKGAVVLHPEGVPPELLRRLLLDGLRRIAPDAAPRGAQLTALAEGLRSGRTLTLAGVRCRGGGRAWRFEPAPPRRERRKDGRQGS
jgi:tRNA(Ile)-lysidine synthase